MDFGWPTLARRACRGGDLRDGLSAEDAEFFLLRLESGCVDGLKFHDHSPRGLLDLENDFEAISALKLDLLYFGSTGFDFDVDDADVVAGGAAKHDALAEGLDGLASSEIEDGSAGVGGGDEVGQEGAEKMTCAWRAGRVITSRESAVKKGLIGRAK